ncbi:MAG: GTP-binding protein [Candidatus Heimdallarchaeota archaeon]|nr:MAG: GTP-binding protein [Candidatus Heimdallarchaeota archaeon]
MSHFSDLLKQISKSTKALGALQLSKIIAKVVFGGDGGVGKTTLIQRYLTGEFIDTTKLTIGVGFHIHQMSYQGRDISLSVWDCGGQEQFKQMGIFDNYFRGALVAVLMFDLTRALSIGGLDTWYGFVDQNVKTDIIIVGGKSDLPRDPLLSDDIIEEIIKKYNAKRYTETSSANGLGVDLVFNEIARLSLDKIPDLY